MSGTTPQWRQHVIDVARMLGYTITASRDAKGVTTYDYVGPSPSEEADASLEFEWARWLHYRKPWAAAAAALKEAGVNVRTLQPPRENGASPSRIPAVFEQRNRMERVSDRANKAPRRRR